MVEPLFIGKGEHPLGIGATGNVKNIKVFANYVEVHGRGRYVGDTLTIFNGTDA